MITDHRRFEIRLQKKSTIVIKGEQIHVGTDFSNIPDLTREECINRLVKYVSYNDAQNARGSYTKFKWEITIVSDGCFVELPFVERMLDEARDLLMFRKL